MIDQQELEQSIVRQAVQEAAEVRWERLRIGYVRLGAVASLDFVRVTDEGEQQVEDTMIHRPFQALREAMAEPHGTWLSSTLTVEADLRYRFAFNYDDEPTWGGGSPVLPESFLADLQRFPRPWAEIPDWHPVKKQYSPETWTAETRKF